MKSLRLTSLACALFAAFAPAQALDVTWQGGTGLWSSAGWSGSPFPAGSGHRAFIDGAQPQASSVDLDVNVSLAALQITSGDRLRILDGRALTLAAGTLSNAGLLEIVGTGNFSQLSLGGAVTLAGNGGLLLSDHFRNGINGNGQVLSIAAGQSVRGGGSLGGNGFGNLGGLVNRGEIVVDAPTYGMRIQSNTAIDNSGGGSVMVLDGSTLWLGGGTVLAGGSLTGTGTAALGGGGQLQDIALSGALRINDGQALALAGTLTGTGVLRVAGTGNFTTVTVAADATLAGAGRTELGDHFRNGFHGNGKTLSIAAEHTLAGGGSIGGNGFSTAASILNAGTIAVDAPVYGMRIQTDNGTLQQTATGQIAVADGSTLWLASTRASGGTLSGTGSAALGGGGTFADMALAGRLQVNDGQSISLAGTLTGSGVLRVAGTGNFSHARLAGDTTLAGAGRTELDDHFRNGIAGDGHTLGIAAGHTLAGGGSIGGNGFSTAASILNAGSIAVDAPVYGMRIQTENGTLVQSGDGQVGIADGSTLWLVNTTLSGGRVSGSGTAALGGGGLLRDTALAGRLNVNDGQAIALGGTLTGTGVLRLAGTGNFTYATLAGDTTLAGSGRTELDDHFRNGISGDGHTLAIAAGHTLAGGGSLGGNGFSAFAGFSNDGLLRVEAPVYGLRLQTGVGGSFLQGSQGRVEIADGSLLTLVNARLSGGSVTGEGAAARIGGGGTLADTRVLGRVNIADGLNLGAAGTLTVDGRLVIAGTGSFTYAELRGATTLAGSGSTELGDHFRNGISGAGQALTIAAGHTLRGGGSSGINGFSSAASLLNQGRIVVDAPTYGMQLDMTNGQLTNAGRIDVLAGSTLRLAGGDDLHQTAAAALTLVNGSLIADRVDLDAGTLGGSGLVDANVFVGAATVAPGNSAGRLRIDGTLSFAAASLYAVEANGLAAGSGHDTLDVSGNSVLAGNLALSFGYAAQVGDSFVVLSTGTGTVSGQFASVYAVGGLYELSTAYAAHSVTVTVTAAIPVPEPGSWALLTLGLGGLIVRLRQRTSRHP